MKMRLGQLEIQFFSWIQHKKKSVINVGEVTKSFDISPDQEKNLLSRLSRAGLIIRLIKGVYIAPSIIPPGGKWGPNHLWVLAMLMKCIGAKYQVSGLEVFLRHRFSDQVPNETFVYNTKLSGKRIVGGHVFYFAKVQKERIRCYDLLDVDGEKVPFSSKGRAVFDAIYDWNAFNSLPKAFSWIAPLLDEEATIEELFQCAKRLGNGITVRRIGYILESLEYPTKKVEILKKMLKDTKASYPLIPNLPKRGTFNKRWSLIING